MEITTEKKVTFELTREEVFEAILDYLPKRYNGKDFFLDRIDHQGATVHTIATKAAK